MFKICTVKHAKIGKHGPHRWPGWSVDCSYSGQQDWSNINYFDLAALVVRVQCGTVTISIAQ